MRQYQHSLLSTHVNLVNMPLCFLMSMCLCKQDLIEWTKESAALREVARLQREEGEHLLDSARDRLPKVSQTPRTLRMYLNSIKLTRRQIELEREFGMGALRGLPNSTGTGARAGIRVEASSGKRG